ncbi:hypothetical protein [Neolewinella antarctica]|uniref:Carboxypeptidase regulatory-like domain-containing protein n=1 Tax=Neolewinella antarctica TaxID=442734 RepID=A0ABX0XFW5_9BACT|nr:hypothetical protein [Neolewinella antarctica]NJC27763.1 hypothetical protein [Neolewinella antarctica]
MRSLLLYPALFALVILSACREDGVTTNTITGDLPTPAITTTTLSVVTAERPGNNLTDASISGLSTAAKVNPDGSITIQANQLDPNGTAVTVTKPGFWPENRRLLPAGEGELRETFVMEPKVKAGEINPSTGGTIELGDNFSVKLPPNTIVTTEDGTPFTGAVEVFVNHDAPEDADEMLNSATNFLARTASGEMAALESYGMMDIALQAADGTPLKLDGSTPAEVRMPIKAATQANAPDEVPFWVLSPEGFWLPDGVARLAPGCYVVYITTSSTCNIDVPHPVTRICGRFVDPNGLPLTHTPFLVNLEGGMSVSAARVDCEGYFCVDVAANVPLVFNVTDPCTDEIFVFALDPVDPNTSRDIGEITVDLTNPVFVATVRDCSGSALPDMDKTEIWVGGNGGNDGEYFAPTGDGTTVINLIDCSGDDLFVQAFTNDYKASSRVVKRSAAEDTPTEFILCGELSANEYIDVTIGGVKVPITELVPIYWPDNGSFDWLVRAAGEFEGEEYSLFLQFAEPHEGTFSNEEASAAIYRLLPGQAYGEGRVYVNPKQNLGLQGITLSDDGMTFEGAFDAKMNLQSDVDNSVEKVGVAVQVSFRLEL